MIDYPPQKILVSTCSKLPWLSACKKATALLISFLTCCREIANFNIQAKNQLHPSHFPWNIAKILQTYSFWYFGHILIRTPKVILSSCGELLCLSAGKKLTSSPMLLYIPHFLQRYANLFSVLWSCLVKLTQNDIINL